MKLFKYGGLFFIIVGCFLVYGGIKDVLKYIDYHLKSEVSTAYITKKTFHQETNRYKGKTYTYTFYKGDYYYVSKKDTIFEQNVRLPEFTPNKDTMQYYGSFQKSYFPTDVFLFFDRDKYRERALDGTPQMEFWTLITPFFIGGIFLLIGTVFYKIGKVE